MNDLLKFPFWRKHGLSLLMAGAALIAMSIALLVHSRAEQALLAAKSSYQQQQSINLGAEESAALLAKYLIPYQALQARGVIGHPQRLQWLETLHADVNHHLIPAVNFTLSPTAIATEINTTYRHESLTVKVTPMRIEFNLLHEGDFYHLLAEIQVQSKGLFSAQNCEIRRNEGEAAEASNSSNNSHIAAGFKGQCELLWYSLGDITRAWEVLPDGK